MDERSKIDKRKKNLLSDDRKKNEDRIEKKGPEERPQGLQDIEKEKGRRKRKKWKEVKRSEKEGQTSWTQRTHPPHFVLSLFFSLHGNYSLVVFPFRWR